jgi:voltage-gated potassium channel
MKKKIHNLLSVSQKKGDASWWFDFFIISLISLNVLAIILESVNTIKDEYDLLFRHFEFFSISVFTIEYLLRVWTTDSLKKLKKPIIDRIKYCLTPMAIIDLFAILPFYLSFLGIDLRILRMIRVFRLFRLLKIVRYLNALKIIKKVFLEKKEELIISFILTIFLLLFSSTLMYYVENEAQPELFSSIPETMWWGIATLTTVGYGDVYPITTLGKVLGGAVTIIGIGLFALPTGILASGFSDHISQKEDNSKKCPHCGEKL